MRRRAALRMRLTVKNRGHFLRLKPKSEKGCLFRRMYINGEKTPRRRICPKSLMMMLNQGVFLRGIMARDRPTQIPPAARATKVSREGCQQKSLDEYLIG
jgi:hypothetical protein